MSRSIRINPGAARPPQTTATMTLTLTPEEIEIVYFALNDYSLKYMNASHTWGNMKPYGPDYAEQKATEIGRLQIKVGENIFETN